VKLLAADIGNTNLTLGLFDGERLIGSWRATSRTTATSDELATLTAGLLALDGHSLSDLDAVALASVVPPLTSSFQRFVSSRLGLEPAIVVDVGTSTNFDLVSADGAYIGGAIAPGLGLSLEALVGYASKLPRIDLVRPARAIGTNTVTAMQSGTVLGYIGLVSGLLTALRGELVELSPAGARITVIATGGYTYEPWLSDVPGIDAIEPDLTLRGVRYAYAATRAAAEATT
jgi:type III pantothenate kinase